MCGIAGAFGDHAVCNTELARADLHHRGPDGYGVEISGPCCLVHTRLAIIDIAGGRQPFRSGGDLFVANGEIYNYLELRVELQARGAIFATASDCEVLFHGLRLVGPSFVERCEGMFAFAWYDERMRRLVLGRDRLGKKPLFWRMTPEGLHFASELPALLHQTGPVRLRREAFREFLRYSFLSGPGTVYSDIQELPPAHLLHCQAGVAPRLVRYWKPTPDGAVANDATIAERLEAAVDLRLRADVPVGVFLSGGLDSAIIATLARRRLPELSTFSMAFGAAGFDESAAAAAMADHLGTRHYSFRIEDDFFVEHDHLLPVLGQPYGDASAVAVSALSRAARQGAGIKVVLTGDGADELFGGYRRYRMAGLLRSGGLLPRGVWALVARLAGIGINDDAYFAAHPLKKLRLAALFLAHATADQRLFPCHFTPCELANLCGDSGLVSRSSQAGSTVSFRRMIAEDLEYYLPGDILVKADRAGMLHGLEIRCPFLDSRLVGAALALPDSALIDGPVQKAVLKRLAVSSWGLPPVAVYAPKHGFEVALTRVFRATGQAHRQEMILSELAGVFAKDAVAAVLAELPRRDAGFRIFLLYSVAAYFRWLRQAGIRWSWAD